QRAVSAWARLQKDVGLSADADAARIDDNGFHAARARLDDIVREDQRSRARVMTPEQKSFAVLEIRRRQIAAEGVAEAGVLVPVAYVRGRNPVRTADRVKQSPQPALGVVDGRAALGAATQHDRLGAVALADVQNPPRDVAERFVPGNPLPARIGVALGTRALERIIETLAMVNQLRRGFAFDAHDAAVGMVVIGIEPGDAAVLDGGNRRTVRGAKGAITANVACRTTRFSDCGHGLSLGSNRSSRSKRSRVRSPVRELNQFGSV